VDEAGDAARERSRLRNAVGEAVECRLEGREATCVDAVDGVLAASPDEAEGVAAEMGAMRLRDDVDEGRRNGRVGRVTAALQDVHGGRCRQGVVRGDGEAPAIDIA